MQRMLTYDSFKVKNINKTKYLRTFIYIYIYIYEDFIYIYIYIYEERDGAVSSFFIISAQRCRCNAFFYSKK